MDLSLVLVAYFEALHECASTCERPCIIRQKVSDYFELVQKVTGELSGRAAYVVESDEDTILDIYWNIITRIWIEADLEHADIDRQLTVTNELILEAARGIAREEFSSHPNFMGWIVD
jgi:hypothetical protein